MLPAQALKQFRFPFVTKLGFLAPILLGTTALMRGAQDLA